MTLSPETRLSRRAIVGSSRTDRSERTDMRPEPTRFFAPLLVACAVCFAFMFVVALAEGRAESTPVGALPAGPVSTVKTQRGLLVAVALPRPKPSSGLVWRIARQFDAGVVRQLDEVETVSSVVVVFKAVGYGKTSIVFALTIGDASPKALSTRVTTVFSRAKP
jgi:hypothetical protein